MEHEFDPDLNDILDLEFDLVGDPTKAGVSSLIDNQLELTLPWKKGRQITLGQGMILSGKAINQPPKNQTPFAELDPKLKSFVFRELGASKYREESSSGSSSSMTHISGSIEVNVDLVVASGSARGEYDKLVRANTDSEKASIHSSFRIGLITFGHLPRLSFGAECLVPPRFSSKARQEAFVEAYGDYYVAGLVLGGDNSLLLSATESSSSESEELKVKVTVKVLWVKKSFEHRESKSSSELNSEVNVAAFDSLDDILVDIRPQPPPLPPGWDVKSLARALGGNTWLASIIEQILKRPVTNFHVDWEMIYNHLTKAKTLEGRIRAEMARFGLVDGASISQETCTALINAGLVAEVLLVPVSKHPSYCEQRNRIY